MIGTLLGILGLAALFARFGVMRPADASQGCHACSLGDGSSDCGVKCPLLNGPSVTAAERESNR